MANELTRRAIGNTLPTAQGGVTDTYVRPNLPKPLAPQALPQIQQPYLGSNNVSSALQELINPILGFTNEVIEADRIQVSTQEELRVSKMAIEEVRAELMGQARDAEGAGLLAPGANPYRKVVAQEYLAERVMRDEFEKAISAETARFSNPLSNEDPAPFAREKYGTLTHGMGYFAQRRAVDLYDSMTKNWLSQVQNTKSARLVTLNEEQLYDNSYNAFRTYQEEVDDPDITHEQAYLNLKATTEYWDQRHMQAVGPGGREHSVKALAAYINAGVQQATDEDDLAKLTELLTKIEEEVDGPLAFNNEQRAEVDAIRTLIHKKSESFDNTTNQDHDDAVAWGRSQYYLILDEQQTAPAPAVPLGPDEIEEELRNRMAAEGLPPTAIAEVIHEEIPGIEERRHSLDKRDEDRNYDNHITKVIDVYGTGGLDAAYAYIHSSNLSGKFEIALEGIVEKLDREETSRDNDYKPHFKSVAALTQQKAVTLMKAVALVFPESSEGWGDNLFLAMTKAVDDAAKNARAEADWTPASIQEAARAELQRWNEVMSLDEYGVDFDLERAKELNFDSDTQQIFKEISQSLVAGQLKPAPGEPGEPTPVPDLGAAPDPKQLEDVRSEIQEGNFTAAMRLAIEDLESRRSHIKAISGGEPYGTWDMLDYFAGAKKSEVKPDGVYSQFTHMDTGKVYSETRDQWQTDRYELDKRLSGLTLQELTQGVTAEGMKLDASTNQSFLNPSQTVMLDPEKFDTHLQELIDANKNGLVESAILKGTEFGKIYNAYAQAVGVGNELSFEDFIMTQISTVMFAVHPVTPEQIKALEESTP